MFVSCIQVLILVQKYSKISIVYIVYILYRKYINISRKDVAIVFFHSEITLFVYVGLSMPCDIFKTFKIMLVISAPTRIHVSMCCYTYYWHIYICVYRTVPVLVPISIIWVVFNIFVCRVYPYFVCHFIVICTLLSRQNIVVIVVILLYVIWLFWPQYVMWFIQKIVRIFYISTDTHIGVYFTHTCMSRKIPTCCHGSIFNIGDILWY